MPPLLVSRNFFKNVSLPRSALLICLFLVFGADCDGLSFYEYHKIGTLSRITVEELRPAKDSPMVHGERRPEKMRLEASRWRATKCNLCRTA
jgi:hypothetical protein